MMLSRTKIAWCVCAIAIGTVLLGLALRRVPVRADQAPQEDLPDLSLIKDPEQKKNLMLSIVPSYLNCARSALPRDPMVRANCDLAWRRASADYDSVHAKPFAVAAWVQQTVRKTCIWVLLLNVRRETSRTEVACVTPDGKTLSIVLEWHDSAKWPDLIDALIIPVEFAPLQELIARAKPGEEGNLVVLTTAGEEPKITLPEGLPLAAAAGDRNGQLSNFVPVVDLRKK